MKGYKENHIIISAALLTVKPSHIDLLELLFTYHIFMGGGSSKPISEEKSLELVKALREEYENLLRRNQQRNDEREEESDVLDDETIQRRMRDKYLTLLKAMEQEEAELNRVSAENERLKANAAKNESRRLTRKVKRKLFLI